MTRRFFRGCGRAFGLARRFTGNLLFAAFLIVLGIMLFSGPTVRVVPDGSALVIRPQGAIVEQQAQVSPLAPFLGDSNVAAETQLRDLVDALLRGAEDERIALVVLDLNDLNSASPAHLEALATALAKVKAAGKEIIAAGDFYSQPQYYLASFADAVYMHPLGQVLLQGYGAYQSYFLAALDKLKVKVHVFRVGTYKEAVEPFTRNDMSPEAREANQALVGELWDAYTSIINANRRLDAGAIDDYVANFPEHLERVGGDMARLALEAGLVDELLTRDEVRARLIAKVGEAEDDFKHIDHRDYLHATASLPLPSTGGDIGVIVAAGVIQMGEAPRGSTGADTLTAMIRAARLDPTIRAAVLRVDSPGGSAFASELIRQELELFQLSGKPLVVSMAGAAASGGYWISATADEIWASPTTITGSIGIFGILPTFEDSLAAVGISRDGVGSTPLAGAMDPFGGMTDATSRIVQANVENGYARFLNLVARGRDMLPADVDGVGQGRVWTGKQAHERGLVDHLGGLDAALAAAAARAGLIDYEVRYLEKPLSARDQLFAQIIENLGFEANSGLLPSVIGALQRGTELLASLNDPCAPVSDVRTLQGSLRPTEPAAQT
ncbi:MAG: signal peptide peptidase SppA [Gammaproteobacteria bacterium]|nr:signal peptide peptidase SppA [Gammaproteobacteria bacterium]